MECTIEIEFDIVYNLKRFHCKSKQITMSTVACARCRHRDLDLSTKLSYAGSLVFESSFAVAWKADEENANTVFVPGLTAYCTRCGRNTWLSRHEDPMEALVDHHTRMKTNEMMRRVCEARRRV